MMCRILMPNNFSIRVANDVIPIYVKRDIKRACTREGAYYGRPAI